MTDKEDQGKRNVGKREKILISAVVIASIIGVVGGAALGVTVLSSNPEGNVPGTAPTTTPMAPLAGTAGDTSVSGVSVEDIEYRGEYDHTQDRPHWESPSGSGSGSFGLYTGGAYSVNVTLIKNGNALDIINEGGSSGAVEMNPVMYLKLSEDGTEPGMALNEPQGQNGSRRVGGTLSEAETVRIEVLRATEANPTMEIQLSEFGGEEIWLGGTANEPHYLISE